MVYIIMGILIALGFVNLYIGKKVIIRPGINKMDMVILIFVGALFMIVSRLMKSDLRNSIIMAICILFYIFTSRWARGITKNGINVIGNTYMLVREIDFDKINPIKVMDDGDYLQYPIKIKGKMTIDIQRYKKEKKSELADVFSKNKVIFTYK